MTFLKIKNSVKIFSILLFYSLIFVYTIAFNNSTGWMLFFFLVFLMIVDLISLFPSLKMIKLETTELTTYTVNQPSQLTLELFRCQKSLLPTPSLTISLKKTLNSSLYAQLFYMGTRETFSFQWTPEKRGIFNELPLLVGSTDFLALFQKQLVRQVSGPFMVMPELQKKKAELIFQIILTKLPNFKNSFGNQTFSIRNFRSHQFGDALKTIDWKQSVKRNELIVKEYEHEIEQDTELIFYGQDGLNFESLLSLYYSFTLFLERQMPFSQTIIVDSPMEASHEQLFALASSFTEHRQLPMYSNKKLILFAPSLTQELGEQLELLQKNNTLFLITYHDDKPFLHWKEQIIELKWEAAHG
ncbi:DUF58 domain-containing protein [Enterococcus sp. BWT-B8]|uniref:DUF58 domain-containing protein n=1 Tax=unclassified Enterococcus TaxID=2608891 RepID=UPI001E5627E1|nr:MULTISPECIES: DUF58 domain-containing protein [unclassified Enterococcus]MCB5952455.1 DUF58 domain-containing protein [Enterococcus sp. BWT-B8]MCB5953513.1 DUF58 domain-containing protein [Enterococcus sp. CWB-B31]